jgi:hypothetical protein
MIDFSLVAVEIQLVLRPFDMNVVLRLGGMTLEQTVHGVARKAITTTMSEGRDVYLFTTRFTIVCLYRIKRRLCYNLKLHFSGEKKIS